MTLDLPTLDARARGLTQHLLGRAALEELATVRSVETLAHELERQGQLVVPVQPPFTAPAIESAVRHGAAHLLKVLSVWAAPGGALELFYADQDRRSLRALLRGALQAAPSETRMAGLLPTPWLPERALTVLARQPTPARVAAQLILLHHPDATALSALTAKAHPVLLDLERALVQGFARRSVDAARSGDRNLRAVTRARIDVCNMEMALLFVAGPRELEPDTLFTQGGAAVSRAAFVEVCRAASSLEASDRLVHALAGHPLQAPARSAGADPVRLEIAALQHALSWQRRVARVEPLGSAPLVLFLLRLAAQSADLRRLAWGVSLAAPPDLLRAGLVTPWS